MKEQKQRIDPEIQTESTRAGAQIAGARRRLLKDLVAGSSVVAATALVPQKWTAPIVQSVLLPAHAAGSPGGTPGPECMEELAEVECPPGSLGTITRYLNNNNPYTCGTGELTLLGPDCPSPTDDNRIGNNDKIGFVITGVPDEVESANAGWQLAGSDTNGSIQSSKCVDNNGGTLDWDTSNGDKISAAVGTDGSCLQLVVQYHCDAGCDGGVGGTCILGYAVVVNGTPAGCAP